MRAAAIRGGATSALSPSAIPSLRYVVQLHSASCARFHSSSSPSSPRWCSPAPLPSPPLCSPATWRLMRGISHPLSPLVAALVLAGPAFAAEVKIAVAANSTDPAKEIAARFKARTGHDATLSFGSSGQFYTQ